MYTSLKENINVNVFMADTPVFTNIFKDNRLKSMM